MNKQRRTVFGRQLPWCWINLQDVTPKNKALDVRAAEDPRAGSQDQPTGTGENDIKKGYRFS
nr:hypothetical protein [Stutzerimonas stutzeri]